MPKGPFLASDFTPTQFSTAAEKAEFGNALLHFTESEWGAALFTKSLYNRLSMCFGHIAHYVEVAIMRSVDWVSIFDQRRGCRRDIQRLNGILSPNRTTARAGLSCRKVYRRPRPCGSWAYRVSATTVTEAMLVESQHTSWKVAHRCFANADRFPA